MPSRTPPQWFVRKLKLLGRNLSVTWSDRFHRWVIAEAVPTVKFMGYFQGNPIYSMKKVPQRILYAEDLGSKILDWLRRVKINRFNSMQQMIKELDIDESYYGKTGAQGLYGYGRSANKA